VAGLDAIREQFPAIRVVAGDGAAAFLSHPRIAKSIAAEDGYLSSCLKAEGYPAGRPPVDKAPSLEGALVCSDREELDLGGLTLRFLAVGGHAPGNLAVFIPEMKTLLASDSLGFYYPGEGFFPLFFTGYGEYMAALDRLESLRPEIIGLGHYGWMRGAEVDENFALARRCASFLRERLKNDHRDEETAISGVFKEFYRDGLTLYSRENILDCCRLLLRRSREEVERC
jgi:glyoxylase-like metal-dependent hydrolase (beta-lactamase superfamily II)